MLTVPTREQAIQFAMVTVAFGWLVKTFNSNPY